MILLTGRHSNRQEDSHPSLSAKELTTDLLIRYGFQILGALVILGVGLLLARYVGNLTGRWLERRALEPPVRSLMVKTVRVVVLIFTLVVALDKFGFQVAPRTRGASMPWLTCSRLGSC